MYNSYPPVIALCIAFVMLFCLAVPHFSNQMEQKEADVQITKLLSSTNISTCNLQFVINFRIITSTTIKD